jgi:hypothetical protein
MLRPTDPLCPREGRELLMRPVLLALLCCLSPSLIGCGKVAPSRDLDAHSLVTKEEVGAIIGVPVTTLEINGKSSVTYRTANSAIEAKIEVIRPGDEEATSAVGMMDFRRAVTCRFGGDGATAIGVGDDASFGVFNELDVRKGDVILSITPPNLHYAAAHEAYDKMTALRIGSPEWQEAAQKLAQIMKTDPASKSLAQPDTASATGELINHLAAPQATEYETKARAMARALAEKALTKIGS